MASKSEALTVVVLLDSALALQVDDVYILCLYAILSVYAKCSKLLSS